MCAQVLDSMFTSVKEKEAKGPLKQDLMEGVAEEEWVRGRDRRQGARARR